MLNHIVLMGRLTRDPELRHTPTGLAVTTFSLAVERDFGSKERGERQTDFIDIVAWRNTAEFVYKYFTKGRMAVVSGRLQLRDWQDRDGNKRRSAEVVAENVYFGDSRRDTDGTVSSYGGESGYPGSAGYSGNAGYTRSYSQSSPSAGSPQNYAPPSSDYAELEEDDGDLPF